MILGGEDATWRNKLSIPDPSASEHLMESAEQDELRRYTELPWLIETLKTKKITMLSPSTWDDKNDAHFMDSYRLKRGKKGLLALCLVGVEEQYHHWKVFAPGPSGVCIVYKKQDLINCLANEEPDILSGKVRYRTKANLEERPPKLDQLPFTKQWQYKPDAEYRFILERDSDQPAHKITISLEAISRVVLSPWLPRDTQKIIRDLLKGIPGCDSLARKVSTAINDPGWMSHATTLIKGDSA